MEAMSDELLDRALGLNGFLGDRLRERALPQVSFFWGFCRAPDAFLYLLRNLPELGVSAIKICLEVCLGNFSGSHCRVLETGVWESQCSLYSDFACAHGPGSRCPNKENGPGLLCH